MWKIAICRRRREKLRAIAKPLVEQTLYLLILPGLNMSGTVSQI